VTVRQFAADGFNLVAEEFGRHGDPPIILLHGGGQSRSAWREAARALSNRGYHALALDMRGHGESDWSPDGDYAFARYAEDIAAVVDQVGQPAVLVGASHGGLSALVAASTYPEMIRALALADVTPWLDEEHADLLRADLRSAANGFDNVDEAGLMVARLRGTPPRTDNEGLRPHMREGADGRLYWRWDPRFIEDRFVRHGGEEGLLAQAARRLRIPVLLMHAQFSNIVDHRQIEAFRTAVPWLRVVQVDGIGHMVAGDDNMAYLPALTRFLDENPVVSGSR
jgi:pimeloyl-ACP methyl ester carboxylesterase